MASYRSRYVHRASRFFSQGPISKKFKVEESVLAFCETASSSVIQNYFSCLRYVCSSLSMRTIDLATSLNRLIVSTPDTVSMLAYQSDFPRTYHQLLLWCIGV